MGLQKTQPENVPILENHKSHVFDKLIQTIPSKPVLAVSRPGLLFVIDTDISYNHMGVALFLVYSDIERKPFEIWSRSLNLH